MDCSLAGSSVYRILQQEYWSGLPRSPPGDLPDPGLNLCLLCLLDWQAGSLLLGPPEKSSSYLTQDQHEILHFPTQLLK